MSFFKKYSYTVVKLIVNQFAISILGNVLAIACGMAKNYTLMLVTSIFAVLFYVFLNYSALWEIGYKEIPSIATGRLARRPLAGLYMSLLAAIPNVLLAVLVTLGNLLSDIKFFSTLGGITAMVAIWLEGMYTGILSFIKIDGHAANSYWISYFIIIIPGLIAGWLGYYFGIRNFHLTRILIAETPEEAEKKRVEKEKHNK